MAIHRHPLSPPSPPQPALATARVENSRTARHSVLIRTFSPVLSLILRQSTGTCFFGHPVRRKKGLGEPTLLVSELLIVLGWANMAHPIIRRMHTCRRRERQRKHQIVVAHGLARATCSRRTCNLDGCRAPSSDNSWPMQKSSSSIDHSAAPGHSSME